MGTGPEQRVTSRTIESGDVTLAVYVQGDPADPTVLLVHGYPDTHRMWDGVAARLARRYHVVRYDVRGAGASTAPRRLSGYRLERLAEDLFTVADTVSPGRPVHVVAHDWGSVQSWEAVTEPHAQARIASYTSISGPCLDHIGHWMRRRLSNPTPRNLGQVIGQQLKSWYIAAFQLPVLPELTWRLLLAKRFPESLRRRENIPPMEGHPAPTLTVDAIRGIQLYRANVRARLSRPGRRETAVPVQILVPGADPFVTPALTEDAWQWVPTLWRRPVSAGHWVPVSRPEVVARMVEEFIDHVCGEPMTRALRRTRVQPVSAGQGAARPFADRLVVITGGGSGIGAATARAFAGLGADVIIGDVDLVAARRVAKDIGPSAIAERVDVADERDMRRFADKVVSENGVPDVVVNNAGIGVAGSFLDTTISDWRRVLDVNLLGVVHGCQAFGKLMVEAGEGGHIVNVASAAAFMPSKVLSAYSASKAAVLAMSECVRAEFASHGIGVSAVCPGFIATNITRTTRFAGVDDSEQDRLRDQVTRAYQRRGFGPERVAPEVVRAVLGNIPVVPVTVEAKAALLGSRFAPGLVRRLARLNVPRPRRNAPPSQERNAG